MFKQFRHAVLQNAISHNALIIVLAMFLFIPSLLRISPPFAVVVANIVAKKVGTRKA